MIQNIGIVGAGQMGNGIAHVAALAGYDVKMVDISRDQLDKAVAIITKNLNRQASKGKISEADVAARYLCQDLPKPEARSDPLHQHLVDLGDPSGRCHRPPRQVHGHALHEPGAGDEAGRADPWDRH
jgi:hypothetical protein